MAQQRIADKMRRIAQAETLTSATEAPGNYLSPYIVNSITSVKGKDKIHWDKLIAQTLMEMILNSDDDNTKLKAIDRYQKLTQSSQLLIKNGAQTAAVNTDGPTVLNLDLSSHITSDEEIDTLSVKSRDLVKEKNDAMFGNLSETSNVEDAEFEVLND